MKGNGGVGLGFGGAGVFRVMLNMVGLFYG